MRTHTSETVPASSGPLHDLDFGGFGEAHRQLDATPAHANDSESTLWRAEMLVYLDRTEEAAAALDRIDEAGGWSSAQATLRATVLRAEIALFQGQRDAAEQAIRSILSDPDLRANASLHARVWLDLGRISRRRSQFSGALEYLLLAKQYALAAGNEYVEGLSAYYRAICYHELSNFEAADACYREARSLLSRVEGLRYSAAVDASYGGFLADQGRLGEALELIGRAEQIALGLGVVSDALWHGNNLARTLIRLGRYQEALERTHELAKLERAARHSGAEMIALQLQSQAALATGDSDLAVESAESAARLADLGGSEADRLDAELLAGRARAHREDDGAVMLLRDLVKRADESRLEHQRVEARMYLAEALVRTAPVEAAELCREVSSSPLIAANRWLRAELARVERLVETAPIRSGDDGVFRVDVRTQWPTLRAARESLERFLITKAVEATHGNLAAAGRLLGETRFQMHYLWKMMHDSPARSSSRGSAAEGRKRRPRNLFADRRPKSDDSPESQDPG